MAIYAQESMIEVWVSVLFIVTAHQKKDTETVIHVQEWIARASRYQNETIVLGSNVNISALGTSAKGTITLPPLRTSP